MGVRLLPSHLFLGLIWPEGLRLSTQDTLKDTKMSFPSFPLLAFKYVSATPLHTHPTPGNINTV